jgi:hypothetical protein
VIYRLLSFIIPFHPLPFILYLSSFIIPHSQSTSHIHIPVKDQRSTIKTRTKLANQMPVDSKGTPYHKHQKGYSQHKPKERVSQEIRWRSPLHPNDILTDKRPSQHSDRLSTLPFPPSLPPCLTIPRSFEVLLTQKASLIFAIFHKVQIIQLSFVFYGPNISINSGSYKSNPKIKITNKKSYLIYDL